MKDAFLQSKKMCHSYRPIYDDHIIYLFITHNYDFKNH